MNDDMLTCESCGKEFPLSDLPNEALGWETTHCPECVADIMKSFRECHHEWEATTDDEGVPAHLCHNCGFTIRDSDFARYGLTLPNAHGAPA